MFPEHIYDRIKAAEAEGVSSRAQAYAALRPLGLEDFGWVLWNTPLSGFPALSAQLPLMASEEVTKRWTGAVGRVLLEQSVSFVRSCAQNYASHTGKTLDGKKILDFGCGYGRFLRLFSYFTDQLVGVDAWDKSLQHCRDAGLGDLVSLSDEAPESLPVENGFDFIFSFSVFTHLSEKSTRLCLSSLRKVISPDGLLVITVRPVEFWSHAAKGSLSDRTEEVRVARDEHYRSGFAFVPQLSAGSRAQHYGDSSLTLDWLSSEIDGWEIVAVDRALNDSLQRYVFLRPV